MPEAKHPEDKRKFERVDIAHDAQVMVLDHKGHKAGVLRQLARGGFMMDTDKDYSKDNKVYSFTIHEPSEDIRVTINARPRYVDKSFVGFEFVDLDHDAAVEVGLIMGTYYDFKHK
jgi:hypothetical protein